MSAFDEGERLLATAYVEIPTSDQSEFVLALTDAPVVVRWDHGGDLVAVRVLLTAGVSIDMYLHRGYLRRTLRRSYGSILGDFGGGK
jgi:hypothetical protein